MTLGFRTISWKIEIRDLLKDAKTYKAGRLRLNDMTRLWMLDTNTVSYIVRGKSPVARARLYELRDGEIGCISVITEAELRYGAAKLSLGSARVAALNYLFDKLRILPWGSAEALVYGELRAKLERTGKTLGNLDMLIAAHAVSTN